MENTMEAIRPLWTGEMPLSNVKASMNQRKLESPFGQIFSAALERDSVGGTILNAVSGVVEDVRQTDAERVQMEYLMATGQLDNPALLTIAATKAQLSVELLIQLRNRAMDAYNELMRMSV